MSQRYRLTFNLSSTNPDAVTAAVLDVARLIEDHRCIVESVDHYYVNGVAEGLVRFVAANDLEANVLADKAQRLPGLPPMDAVVVRPSKKEA